MRPTDYIEYRNLGKVDGMLQVSVQPKWWGWPILLWRTGALQSVLRDVRIWQYPRAIVGFCGVWWRLARGA